MDQPLFAQPVDHAFGGRRVHPDQTPQMVLADPRLVPQLGQHGELCRRDIRHPPVKDLKVALVREAQLEPDLLFQRIVCGQGQVLCGFNQGSYPVLLGQCV